MVTIDPRTLAVGPGGGRGVLFVVFAMALGLAASGWIASLDCGDPRPDVDFVCVEDGRGGACPPLSVELREDRFDNEQANAADDAADLDDELALDDIEELDEPGDATPPSTARISGMVACVFHEPPRAREAWNNLGESDRLLLQRFCKKNGVTVP